MSLDRLTLEGYLGEIQSRLCGRRIEKVRPHGKWALKLELSSRDLLLIDVSRALAGWFLLARDNRLPADPREVSGPSRSAALLFKKHLEGARIDALETSGTRGLSLLTSRARVRVRLHGSPGASLFLDTSGAATAHFGGGEWVGEEDSRPGTAMVYLPTEALGLVREVSALSGVGRRDRLSARDPGLLPLLRRWPILEPSQRRLAEVLAGRASPLPFLTPAPGDDAANNQSSPTLVPFEPDGDAVPAKDFTEGVSTWYETLRRADLFGDRSRTRISRSKSELARLMRLKMALERDKGRWPDPTQLRGQAEALLATPPGGTGANPVAGTAAASGAREPIAISIPDPRTGQVLEIRINPRLTWPQNANALYERARNIERRQAAFDERWRSTIAGLEEAEESLRSATCVRSLEDLEPAEPTRSASLPRAAPTRPRYLTSRGLEIVYGRSASENHEVTFKLARREDVWFHVLGAPGGHVVLRNPEGRANREDLVEAASVAAFLSDRRTESGVDVQYTERKHVHPAGGGRGRVRVSHAEVIRVAPQDPAGRLRAR